MPRTPQHRKTPLHGHAEAPIMLSGAEGGLCPARSVLVEPTPRNELTHMGQPSRRKSLRQSPTVVPRTPQHRKTPLHGHAEAPIMLSGAGGGLCSARSVLVEPTPRNELTHMWQASCRKNLRQSPTMVPRTPQHRKTLLYGHAAAPVMFYGAGGGLCPARSVLVEPTPRNEPTHMRAAEKA